jgi:hypothetical protein
MAAHRDRAKGNIRLLRTSGYNYGLFCAECGEPVDYLTKTHLRLKHNLTKAEYLRRHPEHEVSSFWAAMVPRYRRMQKRAAGDGGVTPAEASD